MVGLIERSLRASSQGIRRANQAILSFPSKADLAADLELSRATVQKFFARKPISRENFHKICQRLDLPWQEIAELSDDAKPYLQEVVQNAPVSLDGLATTLREKSYPSILLKCGSLRVLDMSRPIKLKDIYTRVNVLEKVSGRRRLSLQDLLRPCLPNAFDRLGLGRISAERVPAIVAAQQYPRLIILGKPGAGKTTFLKHLALQCSAGELLQRHVPVFISLKEFAETKGQPDLLTYLIEELKAYGAGGPLVTEQLLKHGRLLILLDGLDEVNEADSCRVVKDVRQFSDRFHANQLIMTCRIATREYSFERFTEVEIADFDAQQIAEFAHNWFALKQPQQADQFIQTLDEIQPIRELATNPLLLTFLCLVFEESGDFPSNRAELYQEGLDILLKKWDSKRNIQRDQPYQQLSIREKKDLLSYIAANTFEQGNYFFKQKELEHHIQDYFSDRYPGLSQPDSEAILKSIEAQHGLIVERARGIYSFSHLTLHEYFAARAIAMGFAASSVQMALADLVIHLTNPRWREIFLLTIGMLRQADDLLLMIKQHTDALVTRDSKVQAFLAWLNQKTAGLRVSYPSVRVRAFYLDLDYARIFHLSDRILELTRRFDRGFTRGLNGHLALDLALDRVLTLALNLDCAIDPDTALGRVLERAIQRARDLEDPEAQNLTRSLQDLLDQLSQNNQESSLDFQDWWTAAGPAWTQNLRSLMIQHRNFGHDWHFSNRQRQILRQYYDANQLLVQCLHSDGAVTAPVRHQIETTLLFPASGLNLQQ